MTGAFVSGQARVAVFLEGSQAWCVQPESPSPHPVSQGLLPYLFGDIARYHPEATLASIGELLERARRDERGFGLVLISMDPASSEATRELAEDALEELLEHPHVSEFIENRLFSKCLPEDALWGGSAAPGNSQSNVKVELMRRSVVGAQEAIGRVRTAWDALREDLFAEADDRADFESVLVETGAFRVLTMAVADPANRSSKGEVRSRLFSAKRYQSFVNARKILAEWTEAIPGPSRASGQLVREGPHDGRRERRHDKPPTVSPHEAFQNAIRQKEAILDQLGRRNLKKAEALVEDLVRDQLAQEWPGLAAKSLCDLAKGAKELGFPVYQLAWSSRAKEMNPRAPWVHTHFADALLSQGQLPEALDAYEAAIRDFPEDALARTGQVEVLKAMGKTEGSKASGASVEQAARRETPDGDPYAWAKSLLHRLGRKGRRVLKSSDEQAISQRVVRVLLISPFDDDHQHLRDILKHSNWQQYDARTQGEAIEFLRKNPIPVVICESELPDGAWQDVLSQLGRMQCPPLLVVTSRKTDDRLWSEALNLGAYNVLAKPLNVKEVFHVVGLAWLSWKQRWEGPKEHLRSA